MFKIVYAGFLVFCGCVGQPFAGGNTILSPPYSLMNLLQHPDAWQAIQRNTPIKNYASSILNRKNLEKNEIWDPKLQEVKPLAAHEIHTYLAKEKSTKVSTAGISGTSKVQMLHYKSRKPSENPNMDFTSQVDRVEPSIENNREDPEKVVPGIPKAPIISYLTSFKNDTSVSRKQISETDHNGNGVLPSDVCDRCPVDPSGRSTLSPCTCVGNTESGAGLISITCPDTIFNIEQLKGILTGTDYFTTHVSRFTLQNSQLNGVISQPLWGDLDFHQILLDHNKIDWVDNKAFINSADTLHFLSLKNNSLKQYITGTINELPYLETLDLSDNQQSVIFSDAFTYKALKHLNLANNMIYTLGKNAFAELDNIEELNLKNNLLPILEDEAFRFYHHNQSVFRLIDLSENQISHISDTAFAGLYYVQINLQENQLTDVRSEVFKHVLVDSSYYAEIHLSGNPIICDCGVYWIVEDSQIRTCFDNFMCTNLGKHIVDVTPDDLGNCTTNGINEEDSRSTRRPEKGTPTLSSLPTKVKEKD